MFTDSLTNKLLSSSKSAKNLHNPEQNSYLNLSDLQFELCSNFLKQTKQKIYLQEAELLAESQKLISKVQQRNSFSLKDISVTQDTSTFSVLQSNQDQDFFTQSCKSMLILRKSKSTTCMRRTENDFSGVLRQVQNKCSQRTSQSITNLVQQNKRLKQRVSNVEKKEKQMKKKQLEYEKQQEQIFLLKNKSADYDKTIQLLNAEISTLKSKIRDTQQTRRAKSPVHEMPAVMQLQTSLKMFLHQKQHTISQSSKKLKQLYQEVQKKIQEPFMPLSSSCDKCCLMLKKIKTSIIKYRELMQTEAEAGQNLYKKFKNKFK